MVQMLFVLLLVSSAAYGMQDSGMGLSAGTGVRQRVKLPMSDAMRKINQESRGEHEIILREAREELAGIPKDLSSYSEKDRKFHEDMRQSWENKLAIPAPQFAEFQESDGTTNVDEIFDEEESPQEAEKKRDAELREPLIDRRGSADEKSEAGVKTEFTDMRDVHRSDAVKEHFVKAIKRNTIYLDMENHLYDRFEAINGELGAAHQIIRDDIKRALDIYLKKQSDIAYLSLKGMTQDIDNELRRCRGGKAGLFAHSLFSSQWASDVQAKHFAQLPVKELLKLACDTCLAENEGHPRLCPVFRYIRDYLASNKHEQARLLFHEIQKSHKSGYKHYFYHVYMNPRRVLLLLVAAAAVVGGAYYYFTRDY